LAHPPLLGRRLLSCGDARHLEPDDHPPTNEKYTWECPRERGFGTARYRSTCWADIRAQLAVADREEAIGKVKVEVVAPTVASSNQLVRWLRRVEALRDVA
jgi:hypothetical protein